MRAVDYIFAGRSEARRDSSCADHRRAAM